MQDAGLKPRTTIVEFYPANVYSDDVDLWFQIQRSPQRETVFAHVVLLVYLVHLAYLESQAKSGKLRVSRTLVFASGEF